MDKYAVVQGVDQEQLEKTASIGCPRCGSKLEKHGSVLRCPSHGTEPFEVQNGRQEKEYRQTKR